MSIQTIQPEESSDPLRLYQEPNEASKYRIHKLDTNCDVIPVSDAIENRENSYTLRNHQQSWSNSYINYEQTTLAPELTSKATNEFILTLQGNCFMFHRNSYICGRSSIQ